MDDFNFQVSSNLTHGVGCSKRLGALLQARRFADVVLMVDEGVAEKSPYYEAVEQSLRKAATIVHVELLRGTAEPDYGYLDKTAEKIRRLNRFDAIIGIGVTTHSETPGLGSRAKDDPKFTVQFKGLSMTAPIKVTNDGGKVNALSGATITSRAVCAAATEAGQIYQKFKPQLAEKLKEFK